MNKYSAYIHTLYIELENKADLLPLSHKMLNDDTLSDKDIEDALLGNSESM